MDSKNILKNHLIRFLTKISLQRSRSFKKR